MLMELNRNDLIKLIKGTFVPYELMNDEVLKKMGSYVCGFADEWKWNTFISEDITDEQLYHTYLKLKNIGL